MFWGFAGDLVGLQQMGFGLGWQSSWTPYRPDGPGAGKYEALGRTNWYLPRVLRWLPDLRVEVEEVPAVEPDTTSDD